MTSSVTKNIGASKHRGIFKNWWTGWAFGVTTWMLVGVACGGETGNGNAVCGDGVRAGSEVCDGTELGGSTCESLGYTGGVLLCSSDCTLDEGDCTDAVCGDGALEAPEQCDDADLGQRNCESLGFDGGSLACAADCTYDTAGCFGCGDGVVSGTEECDGTSAMQTDCADLGFDGGSLACGTDCSFDTAGCFACGDGVLNGAEQCDASAFGGVGCSDLGYDGGTLLCSAACTFDTGGCHTCGDGVLNGAEACDGTDLGSATCGSEAGLNHGVLACTSACTLDATGCHECGDGVLQGPEMCDGTEVGSATCQGQTGLLGGLIGCGAGCLAYDTSECYDPCLPNDDLLAIPTCTIEAAVGSFDPSIQWTWTGPNGEAYSIVTPLVANLTDDNSDGVVDLCDTPDVIVVASTSSGAPDTVGHIFVLDGATGTLHFRISQDVDHTITPAIGDIDGDGLPEIVTGTIDRRIIAFEHDGAHKFTSTAQPWAATSGWTGASNYASAVALADLDNDGDVEILAANWIADHNGNLIGTAPQVSGNWSASVAADLDGDGDLELVLGHAAYHHTHTGGVLDEYYLAPTVSPGYPQIAQLDTDPEPEVLVTNQQGITVLEHTGVVKYQDLRPTGDPTNWTTWLRPAAVHDFDGDGAAEFAMSSANHFTVYEASASITWTANVADQSGIASGTAFDFLGDGTAEAMYADEFMMFIFDGTGTPLLQVPRSSGTLNEYPVVADVDNDGAAEVIFTSCQYGANPSPTVQVVRHIQERWVPARRIWNQHTYHVTNVLEDGTIPQFETPHWEVLNTFRANAQLENGGVCKPQ